MYLPWLAPLSTIGGAQKLIEAIGLLEEVCCFAIKRNRIDSARARGLLARCYKKAQGALEKNVRRTARRKADMYGEKSVRYFQEAISEMRAVAPNHCLLEQWTLAVKNTNAKVDTQLQKPTKKDEAYRQTIDHFLGGYCKFFAGPYNVVAVGAECTLEEPGPVGETRRRFCVHKTRLKLYSDSVREKTLLERVDDEDRRALTKEWKPEWHQDSLHTISEGEKVVIVLVSVSSTLS